MPTANKSAVKGAAAALLAWYDRHRRRMPWRPPPGERADPYHVWLSEIMLQQTTVATVGPYFDGFLRRWPTVGALAAADLDDVLHAWQGLGYYARARNLHKCAQVVAAHHGSRFPDGEAALLELPGIGPYTAAAIAAIAFDRPSTPVDGNVERVMARIFAIDTPLPDAKPALKAAAARITPDRRPGDYAQAVMDLGATVCTPRKPRCLLCPWQDRCAAHAAGIEESLPARKAKAPKPTRHGIAFWIANRNGDVLLRRRAERGLLGGMMEIPSSEWRTEVRDLPALGAEAPVAAGWRLLDGAVRHTFTHFHLELLVAVGRFDGAPPAACRWAAVDSLGDHALPTLMKKVAAHAVRAAGRT